MMKAALPMLVALAVAGSAEAQNRSGFGSQAKPPKSPGFGQPYKPLPSPPTPRTSPNKPSGGAASTKPAEPFKPYEPWKPGSVYGKPK